MNWGTRIVLLYTAFIAGILYLVFRCTAENIDLVEKDYYAKELAFQDRLLSQENAQQSAFRIIWNYDAVNGILVVDYPDTLQQLPVTGTITFYRPDNAGLDFKVPVQIGMGLQQIETADLKRGYWKVQADLKAGNTPLYQEEKFIF
jgi:nitrogen fixation protein FixH